jgi:hypothetical protein
MLDVHPVINGDGEPPLRQGPRVKRRGNGKGDLRSPD